MSNQIIIDKINDSISTKVSLINSPAIEQISLVSDEFIKCYNNKGKVLFCGNGVFYCIINIFK